MSSDESPCCSPDGVLSLGELLQLALFLCTLMKDMPEDLKAVLIT